VLSSLSPRRQALAAAVAVTLAAALAVAVVALRAAGAP